MYTNLNGHMIMLTLKALDKPATFRKISMIIGERAGVDPRKLQDSIQETLDGGVRYGFIQRRYRKYSMRRLPSKLADTTSWKFYGTRRPRRR